MNSARFQFFPYHLVNPFLILTIITFSSFIFLFLFDSSMVTEHYNMTDTALLVGMKALSSNCKALVPYGPVGLTLNMSFTEIVRKLTYFPNEVISQLIGHLLGDAHLALSARSITPYFSFSQTAKKFDYGWHVFTMLAHYCGRLPRLVRQLRNGTLNYVLTVVTRTYPLMSELHRLFYVNVNGSFVKFISNDLLAYLNPIVLAYWAMDDGHHTGHGFNLHTNGFTFEDVWRLAGMLHYQFGLECKIQNHVGHPVIYIPASQMRLFVSIVRPHFHSSMMYKLSKKSV